MTSAVPAASVIEPKAADELVVLGKIVGPYGVRGAVRVHPFADDPLDWGELGSWWLGHEGDPPDAWREVALLRAKMHGDTLIAELECSLDRNSSEALQGFFVAVPRALLPPAGKNAYYWADLIGLDVVNLQGQALGRVLGLIETPGNDVLRVGDGVAAERLLPFVDAVVRDVDLQTRCVQVDWWLDW